MNAQNQKKIGPAWNDIQILFFGKLLKETWARHLSWSLIRLRWRFFWLELRFNRNWKVGEFHPWLHTDDEAMYYLNESELDQYHFHVARLRERAHQQEDFDVRGYRRAQCGWLSFAAPQHVEDGATLLAKAEKALRELDNQYKIFPSKK